VGPIKPVTNFGIHVQCKAAFGAKTYDIAAIKIRNNLEHIIITNFDALIIIYS